MFSVEELRFAQKYPFCGLAKKIIKEGDFSLEQVPEQIISRARIILLLSAQGRQYSPQITSSASALNDEIMSFPLAKILVSLIDNPPLTHGFCRMVGKNVFSSLEKEKNEAVFSIAQELGIKFSVGESQESFAVVSLADFLSVDLGESFKLVNQRLGKGKVFLSKNSFLRLLSFLAEKQLFDSLPMNVSGVPKSLKSAAKEISAKVLFEKRAGAKEVALGKVRPEFFPPCIEKLYNEILSGKNMAHMERFALATFMLSVGMPPEQVIELYSYAPNFNKKITSYQVSRLAGKGGTKYSAAGCSKMAEYQLRLGNCPCINNRKIRHPVQYYKAAVFREKKPKE